MSYRSIAFLPAAVRADLPLEAQQLYRDAYNSAWAKYAAFADREPFCHRLARWEVTRAYRRQADGTWRHRVATDRVVQET